MVMKSFLICRDLNSNDFALIEEGGSVLEKFECRWLIPKICTLKGLNGIERLSTREATEENLEHLSQTSQFKHMDLFKSKVAQTEKIYKIIIIHVGFFTFTAGNLSSSLFVLLKGFHGIVNTNFFSLELHKIKT